MTSFRLPSFSLFLMAAVALLFGSSCLNDDNLIGPNCFDGILNNGEGARRLWRFDLSTL